jgi:hypothetical protein
MDYVETHLMKYIMFLAGITDSLQNECYQNLCEMKIMRTTEISSHGCISK